MEGRRWCLCSMVYAVTYPASTTAHAPQAVSLSLELLTVWRRAQGHPHGATPGVCVLFCAPLVPQDALVTACFQRDAATAHAALAAGASVNDEGSDCQSSPHIPLAAATRTRLLPVVLDLLARGADPCLGCVMYYAATGNDAAVLSALIDHGGDVNANSRLGRPVFGCLDRPAVATLQVLLDRPELDLSVVDWRGRTPEAYACQYPKTLSTAAVMLQNEVSCPFP